MKFLAAVALALTAVADANAQNMTNSSSTDQFASGLLDALRQNNLTQLATAVEANAAALLPALMASGNKTVLAPSNQALQALGDVDTDTLVATIAYHVLNGTYMVNDIMNGSKTIAASALANPDFVELPANRSQVVMLAKQMSNNTAYVQQAGRNVSFALTMDGPVYESILVQPINSVLQVPGPTSQIAGRLGASQLTQLLQSANLVEGLDDTTVTVFAPTNEAIMAVMSAIGAATPEQQQSVLLNHVLNGTVVYSTQLADTPMATSASGNELKFMANDTGAYVMSGNITARIVSSDNVAENGVIHVIDAVLVNTTSNAEAAASAASSASAEQATQTSQPGVGTNGNEGAGSGSGSGENSAFSSLKVGGGAAAMAVLASGMWLLA